MKKLILAICFVLMFPVLALAESVHLEWDAGTDNVGVTGYNIYVGTSSGIYGTPINVGNVLQYTVTGLNIGTSYYFAASCYDAVGNESVYSNELFYMSVDNTIPIFSSGSGGLRFIENP